MRKVTLLFLILLFYTTDSFSQDHTPIEKPCYTYCIITGNSNLDFGEAEDYWLRNEPSLRNKKGKIVRFKYLIDALNYMSALGWEMIETYSKGGSISKNSIGVQESATISSNTSRLLRKEVTKEELMQISTIIQEKL